MRSIGPGKKKRGSERKKKQKLISKQRASKVKRIVNNGKTHTIKNIDLAKKMTRITVQATRMTSNIVATVKMNRSQLKVRIVKIKSAKFQIKAQVQRRLGLKMFRQQPNLFLIQFYPQKFCNSNLQTVVQYHKNVLSYHAIVK